MNYEIERLKHQIEEHEREIALCQQQKKFVNIFYLEEAIERLETKIKKLEEK